MEHAAEHAVGRPAAPAGGDAVDYPAALAVEDFVPVLLTTAGVLLLARRAGPAAAARRIVAAAALIGAGGLGKAVWKLVMALDGPDLPWLEALLFPLLTLGFGLLAWTLAAPDGPAPRWVAVLVPGLTLACALGAVLSGRTIPMLVSASVFATVCGVHLIAAARRQGDPLAAGLFGVQLLGFFVLGPLAARPDQTVALQWAEQLCNTAAQAAFAVAAFRLGRMRSEVPR
ncbi:hypothetical protein [Planomonospora venezuelensis]|uniref:YhhN-like protein n=1 Tax=Planomonospora venezuelensis TaxID=1999 RepID=A0A841DH62_PLAVE|nr:hypothetical protein [Planomonospora venezuelensis]MBB5966516.1 hypothetical protein [Planomonospora venezuelensis]GIN02306.1 hypothetical protein Pve01_39640 [Planomonospora venezuelensis]